MASAEGNWSAMVAGRCTGDNTGSSGTGTWAQVAAVAPFLAAFQTRPINDVFWTEPVQPGNFVSAGVISVPFSTVAFL